MHYCLNVEASKLEGCKAWSGYDFPVTQAYNGRRNINRRQKSNQTYMFLKFIREVVNKDLYLRIINRYLISKTKKKLKVTENQ